MKKMLLNAGIFAATIFAVNTVSAQCTPDPLYKDSTFGIWPDTTQNLPVAKVGVAYSTVVDFKIPQDAGDVDPQYSGVTINWIRLDAIDGLSATGLGFSYAAGPNGSSQWNALTQGCVLVTGTPTTAGVYELKMKTTVNNNSPIANLPYDFGGYRIKVEQDPNGISNQIGNGFSLLQNTPNPFTNQTSIQFTSEETSRVNFTVTNLLGEVVATDAINATRGLNTYVFNADNLPSGIYTYSLAQGNSTLTKRMVVSAK